MSKNKNLHKARVNKQNEFYTRRSDIDIELQHYLPHFKDKTVYCNCDDPGKSEFTKFFIDNFHAFGLKKLISTGYRERTPYFDNVDNVGLVYDGEIHHFTLKGNGNFQSRECIELLKQADIVVTNPPFSLFRDYVSQLLAYDKKFLIIGNIGAVTYTNIFYLIRDNRIWCGREQPDTFKTENGDTVQVATYWYTNIGTRIHKKTLSLHKKYTPEAYPKYDNFDAIDVSKVSDIPKDYAGVMGVPIRFFGKHNPDQFDILGLTTRPNTSGLRTKKYTYADSRHFNDLNGGAVIKTDLALTLKYARILIRNKNPK